MAGYVSLNAYDADVRIPQFLGLNQVEGDYSANPCYAVEAVNAYTKGGVLMPMERCKMLDGALPGKVETLARLHRRWYSGENEHDLLIAASGGQLYWSWPDGEEWHQIPLPDDWEGDGYQSDVWSFVTYEINEGTSVLTADDPIDVILLSNAKDGMICVRGDNMTAIRVETPKKFGVITRYAERIWGGAIPDDPDMLVYSAPYDPFNWEQNNEIPEDGAGDVQQPSWDGDGFEALAPFGSQLVAFKRTRVWRVLGTDPGEYVFKEQYGGGTAFPQTVTVDKTMIYMLGKQGLNAYNGETVSPYYQDYCRRIWERMNQSALEQASAALYDGKYYLALPLDDSPVNNAVLVFNQQEGTFLLREGIKVESFLATENDLYFTSSETPGRVWLWKEDSWLDGGECEDMKWVSPWLDFGYKDKMKGSFAVYLTAEVEAERTLQLSIQTEKKIKTKSVTLTPPVLGKGCKQKRVNFGGTGRRFRLIIESIGGTPWRLPGGLQMVVETDDD